SILPATGVDQVFLHPNFRRVTVGHIAARLVWLIGHPPRQIKLLVQGKISDGMAAMFLCLRRNDKCDEDKENDSVVHADPPIMEPHLIPRAKKKLEGREQRGAQ